MSASLTSEKVDVTNDDGTVTVVTEYSGFIYEQIILATLAFIGVLFGIWLWLDDVNNRNS